MNIPIDNLTNEQVGHLFKEQIVTIEDLIVNLQLQEKLSRNYQKMFPDSPKPKGCFKCNSIAEIINVKVKSFDK